MEGTIQIRSGVCDVELMVKEYDDQRVVTFDDIDRLHCRPEGTAKRNFNQNRQHFTANEDFYLLSSREVKSMNFVPYNVPRGLIVLTESGYLMLVKSFTDNLAWKVQRELVKSYFRVKQVPAPQPARQMSTLEILEVQVALMREHETKIKALEDKQEKMEQAVNENLQVIQKAVVHPERDAWREEVKECIDSMVEMVCEQGDYNRREVYRKIYNECYAKLDDRASCDIERRKRNLLRNMAMAGATISNMKTVSKLDVLERDDRLREIFVSIVKERYAASRLRGVV
jgi:hypothetical protein